MNNLTIFSLSLSLSSLILLSFLFSVVSAGGKSKGDRGNIILADNNIIMTPEKGKPGIVIAHSKHNGHHEDHDHKNDHEQHHNHHHNHHLGDQDHSHGGHQGLEEHHDHHKQQQAVMVGYGKGKAKCKGKSRGKANRNKVYTQEMAGFYADHHQMY